MARFRRFFLEYFPNLKNKDGEVQVSCPWHGEDRRPSLSINMKTGRWKCFTCDEAGDAMTFYRKMHNCSFPAAKKAVEKAIGEYRGDDEVPKQKDAGPIHVNLIGESEYRRLAEQVKKWHTSLWRSEPRKKWLSEQRGLSKETIKKFELGWDGDRLTIPIKDQQGKIINVRRYKPNPKGKEPKMMSYKRGTGGAQLFPVSELLTNDDILLCEGEMDAILAIQKGFHAVTVTGGAGSWKEEWNGLFRGKSVAICYDCDAPGDKGARKVAQNIFRHAAVTKVVDLGLAEKGADITDYLHGQGLGKKELQALIMKTVFYQQSEKERRDDDPTEVHLSVANRGEYHGKMLKINVIVQGKEQSAFMIPEKVSYSCDQPGDKKCAACSLEAKGRRTMTLTAQDTCILKMIGVSEDKMLTAIRQMAGVLNKCTNYERKVKSYLNVEAVNLIPEIDRGDTEQVYLVSDGYFVGHGIKANQSYRITALATAEPNTQYATLLIENAEPTQDDVMTFEMTPEIKKELEVFQCEATPEDIEAKITKIHDDLTDNVTNIYGRNDLLMGIDLTMHSVLSFDFDGKRVHRGWTELLILGDTRTGKTETVESLIIHYQAGVLTTGESSTRAGLVGGLQQNQGRWMITWGKIPLNDRKLVAIDEVTGLSQDDIGGMSGIRSSGVAELTKIQTSKTHARTRLIWISNPREAKTVAEFPYGCEAIAGIIGKQEDVARFDLALTCATEEVSNDLINQARDERLPHIYTTDLCSKLVLWAWSRRPNEIVFDRPAMKAIRGYAKKMGADFSSSIPLVEGANQRIKIARLSAAMAARVFSTDETGEKIIVRKAHVTRVIDYLYEIYNKPSLGYTHYSEHKLRNKRTVEANLPKIKEFLADKDKLREFCLNTNIVRPKHMAEFLNEDKDLIKYWMSFLLQNALLIQDSNGRYIKSGEFIKLLRRVM